MYINTIKGKIDDKVLYFTSNYVKTKQNKTKQKQKHIEHLKVGMI